MATPMSIEELLRFILLLVGIGVLGYLFIVLKNMASILRKVGEITEEGKEDIVKAINSAQKTTTNISSITETADETLKSVAPEIDGIVHSANGITGKVESITSVVDDATVKVSESVTDLADSVTDTADQLNSNISNISGYLVIFNKVMEIVKDIVLDR